MYKFDFDVVLGIFFKEYDIENKAQYTIVTQQFL